MLAVIISLVFFFLIFIVWTYCKLSTGICKFGGHLVGKVVIITGANSGIGFETAKNLAERGAFVIAACRNSDKGTQAVHSIIASSKNKNVHYMQLDLASFTSIRIFVHNVLELVSNVDILINNAGAYTTNNEKTQDGFLVGIQINYLGPFLLTSLLLPVLIKSAPSRIINVSSFLYQYGQFNIDNFENTTNFNAHTIYRNAKLYMSLMTVELGRRLQGNGVTVNCLHPGVVNTEMMNHVDIHIVKLVLKCLKLFFKTAWEGAQTSIYLSVSPDAENVTGCYFKDCRQASLKSKAKDLVIAQKLWVFSEELVKLK